jgi:Leucine-rich repeat (LRR) protein
MKFLLAVLLSLLVTINTPIIANGCFEEERDALLTFKTGLDDPGNLMSSWHGQNCCKWSGVMCNELTEHVVRLNLRNPYDRDDFGGQYDWASYALTGKINPSLLSLRHLTHLDLSNHNFSNFVIPKFIGSFENLVYLNLSLSEFEGVIPYELGNLSRLEFLDLGNYQLTGMVPSQLGNLSNLRYLSLGKSYSLLATNSHSWLYHLSNLKYLDMLDVEVSNTFDWSTITNKRMLKTLILSNCYLPNIPNDLSHINLTFLTELDLSFNPFNTTLPNWLWNLTSLLYLNLEYSEFHGSIPRALANLASLNYLYLGSNNFEHVLLEPMSKLYNLRSLDLSWLNIEGDIVNLINGLGHVWYNLERVNLRLNNLSGNISSWIAQMKNLLFIDLGSNLFSGNITCEIGTLTQLEVLYLYNNSLSGDITEAHFVSLSNLKKLDLSKNMLTMNIKDKWVPPFQLEVLILGSCKVGTKFPDWLQGQAQISYLDLTNSSIIGVIPSWFWNMSSLKLISLSYNNFSGNLPTSFQFSKLQVLTLRSNNISGPIPNIPSTLQHLDLSKNQINGNFSHETSNMTYLEFLDLSSNTISGEIPNNFWHNMLNSKYINLANNQITGELPAFIGSLQLLKSLNLYNNNLYGKIPSSLQQCQSLGFLSLGRNNFSGRIPSWIGKQLKQLVVLQLGSNQFTGFIPRELGELSNLRILDLSHNSLVGLIPSSIGNFSSMKNSSQCGDGNYYVFQILYIDINRQNVYTSLPLICLTNIDLSGNKINGQIPNEIWSLQAVTNLNLSENYITGEIPEIIGHMQSLESLDLSFNNLSGLIPQGLSNLSSLHNLNLSYNNFSGKIPTGRQLDTISDSSIYVGNSYLCGPPIDKNCSQWQPSIDIDSGHGDRRSMIWFYLVLAAGFILGFWSVWGVLLFKNTWECAYFHVIDRLFVKMHVHIMLAMRRFSGI